MVNWDGIVESKGLENIIESNQKPKKFWDLRVSCAKGWAGLGGTRGHCRLQIVTGRTRRARKDIPISQVCIPTFGVRDWAENSQYFKKYKYK